MARTVVTFRNVERMPSAFSSLPPESSESAKRTRQSHQTSRPVTRPARPGEFILLFGTGFGQTNPPVSAGQAFPQASPLAIRPSVHIGGVQASVDWAGLVSPGLYQFNVRVPDATADGNISVSIRIGSYETQKGTTIPIKK